MAFPLINPGYQFFDNSGNVLSGGLLYSYAPGTTTPKTTHTDENLSVPNANPVVLDSAGRCTIFLTDGEEYKFVLKDAAGVTIWTRDEIKSPSALTQTTIGTTLYPRIAAEITAGVTPTNYAYGPYPYNLARVGLVANNAGAVTANTAALQALFDPTETGIKGRVFFPNTTGADIYHFNGIIQVRNGISLDLNGCTLHFNKTFAAGDSLMGFLTLLRDVTIENGTIEIDYDGTGGTNAGNGIRIGSRNGYPFGSFTGGVDDEDLTIPQGNVALRNLRITTNNPTGAPILMLGGLDGVVMENVWIDGQGTAINGIYYEFGFWHHEAAAANRLSSHARNLHFKNIRIENLDPAALSAGAAFGLTGALSAKISGLHIDGCFTGVVCRAGEALYYNRGTPYLAIQPHIDLEQVHVKNAASSGIVLQGAESASGGYLSAIIAALAAGPEADAQTDLITYSLNGFSSVADGVGLFINGGSGTVLNGFLNGASSSGQVIINDESMHWTFTNVEIRNSSSVGVRADFGGAFWSPARGKMLKFINCFIAGNTNHGASIANSESVLFENCRFGYNTLYDSSAETTQTYGINVSASTGKGVVADGCYVTTSGGAEAYRNAATGSRGCGVRNPRGTVTFNGSWERNGVNQATATQIADKTSFVNTANKYLGKQVYDTSNTRLLVAQGATNVSKWVTVADFGAGDTVATVTPA